MKTYPIPSRRFHLEAFTLIELLAAIAVIAILGGLVIVGLAQSHKAARRADGISQMRQLGVGVQLYISDHNGWIPGPLYSGQTPMYQKYSYNSLGYYLWSYLDGKEPTDKTLIKLQALSPKAYEQACPALDAPSVLLNTSISINGAKYYPWGIPDNPAKSPLKINALGEVGLANTWAMQDVDQTNPEINSNYGWHSKLPVEPLYSPYRIKLYFDWHVATERIN